MPIVVVELDIVALPSVCFDLARSVEAHVASAGPSGERAVAGVTAGLLGLGDQVTWRGRHFGIVQELTSRIEPTSAGTRMRDVFEFDAPFGIVGRMVERAVLIRYLRRFLEDRAHVLKRLAESGDGNRFIGVA